MKGILIIMITALSLSINVGAQPPAGTGSESADLSIVVTGLKNDRGLVIIKLFNSQEGYDTRGKIPFRMLSVAPEDRQAEGVFRDLPMGDYAIKLYHDENGNGEHDKNFMGIPKEDYAFSNNARGIIGPPGYRKARFSFDQDMTMKISVNDHPNEERVGE